MRESGKKKLWTMDHGLWTISVFFFLLSSFFFVMGCGEEKKVVHNQEIIPVKVEEVKLQTIQRTLDYVGDVKANDEALVYPKVTGKVIEKLKEEGSRIKKGDAIAYVDRDEIGFKFEKAPVESYIDGIVGRVYVDRGTLVTTQTPVALVIDMDKVKIELDIPEKYLPRISLGQKAEVAVDAYQGEAFSGTVSKISPVVELETRTAPIEIVIPNGDHRLKSGMFARAQLTIEEHKNVPVIAKEAIMGKDLPARGAQAGGLYVYAIDGDSAHQKNVEVGIRQGAYYEVTEGLKEGDLVVVMGQQKLYDGAPVSVEKKSSP